MRALPRSRKDLEVVLAVAAAVFSPRETYDEADINLKLGEWLASFSERTTLDHVSLRRYLVDYNLLQRTNSGSRYTSNQTIINTLIEPEARGVVPGDILEELATERALRKRRANAD